MAFADDNRGWAGTLTPAHRLFRLVDAAETWAEVTGIPPGASPKICGLYAASDQVIYGSGTNDPGDPAAIIKSTNGGNNWSAIDMSGHASSLIDIYFTDEQSGWVVGGFNPGPTPTYDNVRPVILRTEDGGTSWTDKLAGMRDQ